MAKEFLFGHFPIEKKKKKFFWAIFLDETKMRIFGDYFQKRTEIKVVEGQFFERNQETISFRTIFREKTRKKKEFTYCILPTSSQMR